MNKEEKFKVWDATNPKVRDVKEYLARLCQKASVPLVYKNTDGQFVYTKQFIPGGAFVGIMLGSTIFFSKGFRKEDIPEGKDIIRIQDIYDWVQKSGFYPQHARPLTKDDARLLDVHGKQFRNTLDILEYHELFMPEFFHEIVWLDTISGEELCSGWSYTFHINSYLESGGHIWICCPQQV